MSEGPPTPESKPLPDGGPWYGLWPGTVVDTKDPEERGRIRVRVDQVYGVADDPDERKIADDDLPFAQPCFPWVGEDVGVYHVPPPGAGVWVSFWMGDHKHPVWMGGWAGTGDAPVEFTGAYGKGDPQPCTRIVKTPTGHTFEMRWCPQEERVEIKTAGGAIISMKDAGTGDQSVSITTPGDFNVTASGKTSQTFALASTIAATLGLTITGLLLALTATTTLTLTAVTVSLVGVIALGIAGTKFRLVTENYITAIQNPNVTAYNGHTHSGVTVGAGATGPPSAPMTAAGVPTHTTTSTLAN